MVKKRKKFKEGFIKKFFKWIIWLIVGSVGIFFILWITSPDVSWLVDENPKETSLMKYREKEAIKKGKKPRKIYKWVPLENISPYMVKAVIVAEDANFYKHEGFDIASIRKAVKTNIKKKKFAVGGSTISQQLSKNLFLSPSKNPIRKLREAVITIKIERELEKSRIMELYLNVIEMGNGIYGIEAASQYYFHKSAANLTPSEAIRIASILPNPLKFSPLSNSYKKINKKRRNMAKFMYKRGWLDSITYQNVLEELSR